MTSIVQKGRQIRWWQWPEVLSLDAPVVAVAWQGALGRMYGVRWDPPLAVLLFTAVWLIYSADRWLDYRKIPPDTGDVLSRYWFFHSLGNIFLGIWSAVLLIGAVLSVTAIPSTSCLWLYGGLLVMSSIAYLFLINLGGLPRKVACTAKEIISSGIFAAGVCGMVISQQSEALIALPFLHALFLLNMLEIARVEASQDLRLGQLSMQQCLRLSASTLVSIELMLAAVFFALTRTANLTPAGEAAALGLLLLAGANLLSRYLPGSEKNIRACVDGAVLIPALIYISIAR